MSPAVLLGIVLMLAALLFVLAPLLWSRTGPAQAQRSGAQHEPSLTRLRDELYAAIVELDFDHAVGKTDEEEYRLERADLKRQALAVLRLLDEQEAGSEDQVEREVAVAREIDITESDRDVASCPACGRGTNADDRYCSGCGRPVAAAAADATGEPDDVALAEEVERQVRALRRDRGGALGGVASNPRTVRVSGRRAR